MKQITAVEWLVKKINDRQNGVINELPILLLDEIFEQAKEMEKQQIIDSYREGRSDQMSKERRFYHRNAEYYFKQTYEK